jgi:hypothetical protein
MRDEGLHPQEVAELLPERDTAARFAHRHLDVRDAVDLDAHAPRLSAAGYSLEQLRLGALGNATVISSRAPGIPEGCLGAH